MLCFKKSLVSFGVLLLVFAAAPSFAASCDSFGDVIEVELKGSYNTPSSMGMRKHQKKLPGFFKITAKDSEAWELKGRENQSVLNVKDLVEQFSERAWDTLGFDVKYKENAEVDFVYVPNHAHLVSKLGKYLSSKDAMLAFPSKHTWQTLPTTQAKTALEQLEYFARSGEMRIAFHDKAHLVNIYTNYFKFLLPKEYVSRVRLLVENWLVIRESVLESVRKEMEASFDQGSWMQKVLPKVQPDDKVTKESVAVMDRYVLGLVKTIFGQSITALVKGEFTADLLMREMIQVARPKMKGEDLEDVQQVGVNNMLLGLWQVALPRQPGLANMMLQGILDNGLYNYRFDRRSALQIEQKAVLNLNSFDNYIRSN